MKNKILPSLLLLFVLLNISCTKSKRKVETPIGDSQESEISAPKKQINFFIEDHTITDNTSDMELGLICNIPDSVVAEYQEGVFVTPNTQDTSHITAICQPGNPNKTVIRYYERSNRFKLLKKVLPQVPINDVQTYLNGKVNNILLWIQRDKGFQIGHNVDISLPIWNTLYKDVEAQKIKDVFVKDYLSSHKKEIDTLRSVYRDMIFSLDNDFYQRILSDSITNRIMVHLGYLHLRSIWKLHEDNFRDINVQLISPNHEEAQQNILGTNFVAFLIFDIKEYTNFDFPYPKKIMLPLGLY